MNMTGLIHWCEGQTRCPLLSSRQSGNCLPHSLTPRCHQLARAQVSLRHRRCSLPPSVISLIISLRWARYLTHRDEEEKKKPSTHAYTAHRHKIPTHIQVHTCGKWPPSKTHTHTINTVYVFMCTNAYTQEFLDSRSVKAWASFVQIIIEMKAEWWNKEWYGSFAIVLWHLTKKLTQTVVQELCQNVIIDQMLMLFLLLTLETAVK